MPLILRILNGALYGDALMWLSNQVKPYELEKGATDKAVNQFIDELIPMFEHGSYKQSKRIYKKMLEMFKAIPQDRTQIKIRIGIVGEIYMKYSPLGNQHLEDYLIELSMTSLKSSGAIKVPSFFTISLNVFCIRIITSFTILYI